MRKDISQIDITALVSGLLGINFPMNSVGTIPLDILDIPDKVKSKILFGNFLELFEIYKIKNDIESKSIIFKPFHPLTDSENKISDIIFDINNEKYIDAMTKNSNFNKYNFKRNRLYSSL